MQKVTGRWNHARHSIEIDEVFHDDIKTAHGDTVTILFADGRSPDQLKFYWAVLGNIVKSGIWSGTKDSLDDYTRQGIGFGVWRTFDNGQSIFVPDSISLDKCSGSKFKSFMHDAEQLWAERLGVDIKEVRRLASADSGVTLDEDGGADTKDATPKDEPINLPSHEERLAAIAFELCYADNETELDSMWSKAKHRTDVIELYKLYPEKLRAVTQVARSKVAKRISAAMADDMIKKEAGLDG